MILPLDVGAMFLSILAVLTLPLYGSLARLLIIERFSGSFYDLFIIVSFLDMLAIAVNFIGVSLTGWGLTSSVAGLWYGRVYLSLAWLTRVNQGTSSALIAVNRAYAMIIPLQYAKIWRRGMVRKLQLLQIIPGILFAWSIVTFDVEYQSFNTTLRQETPRITSDFQISILYKAAGVLEIILVLIIGLSYGSGMMSILRKKYRNPGQENMASKKKSRAEMSATYMGVSICCLELAYFLYSAFSVLHKIPANTYFSLHSSLTDMYSSLNCYLLLAFSKSVRRRLLSVHLFIRLYKSVPASFGDYPMERLESRQRQRKQFRWEAEV